MLLGCMRTRGSVQKGGGGALVTVYKGGDLEVIGGRGEGDDKS